MHFQESSPHPNDDLEMNCFRAQYVNPNHKMALQVLTCKLE